MVMFHSYVSLPEGNHQISPNEPHAYRKKWTWSRTPQHSRRVSVQRMHSTSAQLLSPGFVAEILTSGTDLQRNQVVCPGLFGGK